MKLTESVKELEAWWDGVEKHHDVKGTCQCGPLFRGLLSRLKEAAKEQEAQATGEGLMYCRDCSDYKKESCAMVPKMCGPDEGLHGGHFACSQFNPAPPQPEHSGEALEELADRKGFPKVYYECAIYGAQDDEHIDTGFGGGSPAESEQKAREFLNGLRTKEAA